MKCQKELSAQCDLHQSEIITSINELRELLVSNDAAAASCQDTVARNLSEIQIQVADALAQQNTILSSRKLQMVEADVEAKNADILARLVRFELRQQLDPLIGQFDRATEHIDRIATAFACEAAAKGLFETDSSLSTRQMADPTQFKRATALEPPQSVAPDNASVAPLPKLKKSLQPRPVFLSSTTHHIFTRIGDLSIRLKTYRLRGPVSDRQRTYFELRAHLIPQPWLCSRGVSAMYSSGPDRHGYFSICPSIALVNIIADSKVFNSILINDDLMGFRLLLDRHQIGIWDLDFDGYNLLEVC